MSQIKPKLPQIEENLPSTNWFDLPFEMREMVIDRMDAKTRGRFVQCSKLCEKEGKKSKYFLTAINIDKSLNSRLFIGHEDNGYNYYLEFMDVPHLTFPQSTVYYTTSRDNSKCTADQIMKWTKTENGNAEDIRKRYITETIEKYKKSINKFEIRDYTCSMVDINLKSLQKLEKIYDHRCRKAEDLIAIGSLDVKQIYPIAIVHLPHTRVKFEDVLKFRGFSLLIKSNDFDVKKIQKYLKMWKNQEIHENVRDVTIESVKFEGIEKQKITEGLDAFKYKEDSKTITFQFYLTNDTNKEWVTDVSFTKKNLNIMLWKR